MPFKKMVINGEFLGELNGKKNRDQGKVIISNNIKLLLQFQYYFTKKKRKKKKKKKQQQALD